MSTFRHILVPVDFEPSSERALELATNLVTQFDARLTVFHAWDLPAAVYAGPYITGDVWSSIEGAAKAELEETMTAVRKRWPRAESVLVRGPAGVAILEAIESLKPDLVVLGTHGRHGLPRMVLGSVAEKVVRGSRVPVLTVHGGEAS